MATASANAEPARDRCEVVVHVDIDVLWRDTAGQVRIADGPALAPETARRLACDANVVGLLERGGRTLSVGRKKRAVPPAMRRAVQTRDGGCRFPGCERRRFLDAHHIVHWAHGGETSKDNLIMLCRHHHRLVHEGGAHLSGCADAPVLRMSNGAVVRAGPPRARGDTSELFELNRRHDIGPRTLLAGAGEPMDRDYVVSVMAERLPVPG